MKIIAADDEKYALKMLTEAIQEAEPGAVVHSFDNITSLLDFAVDTRCDIAFLDIKMRSMSGIELAYRLKKLNPSINIIFVTGHSQYAGEAFTLRASGYILKPVTAEAVRNELDNLRNPLPSHTHDKLYIHTFGNFEVFYNGNPVHFKRSKSKELLAYLVDRRGAAATMAEIASVLWEDKEYNRALLSQIHNFLADLSKQLRAIGMKDVIIKKRNSIAIDINKLACDYYSFLQGDISAINAFHGEYMSNYSWAEFTAGRLFIHKKK